ncbi:hypothetical protein K7A41_14970 [Sphingobacterium sp. InxBP1]|uniref:hypothetical protein n=1 Tax=Sphingobacterium sp. InxBP1 TaxID=2870328 RepID=UPI002243BB7D|nr:hypothetical protein [Sphingobacterium sp. InxBP1]MCW8312533.1 hypothetical protein [Sphingobacterium sp. InxBP1]
MKITSIFTCLSIAFTLMLVIISCDDKDGYSDAPNFDSGPFTIDSNGLDSVFVASNDVDWQFLDLTVNGKQLLLSDNSLETKEKKTSSGADMIYLIKGEWFTLEKLDNKRIQVSIDENEGKVRSLDFTVHNGNGFRKISFNQDDQ